MEAQLQVGIVLVTLFGSIYAFVREKFSPDVTALLVLLVLVITGVLTPAEGFAGFSHPATVSVAAVLVLSASLERSGAFDVLARRVLAHIGRSEFLFGLVLMLTVGILSAFINNTAAVAIFLPIVMQTCRRTGARPGRLLLPMSFAAMFGGIATLIGTSTNIVVHEFALEEGLSGFRMFEFARIGVPLFGIGLIYLLFVGRWLLRRGSPVRSAEDRYELSHYVVDVFVEPESSWIGKPTDPRRFQRDHALDLVEVWRAGAALRRMEPWPKLMAHDRLRVHGSVQRVMQLAQREGLRLQHPRGLTNERVAVGAEEPDWNGSGSEAHVLAEVVLLPSSPVLGQTLETARFRGVYSATILGMRRAGHAAEEHLTGTVLRAGDALLLEVTPTQLDELVKDPGIMVIGSQKKPRARTGRLAISLTTLTAVVLTAAVGLLPIVTAASAGCLLLMVTGTLRPREAYESINWQVIFMLAGVLALGTAMEKTGIASAMAGGITRISWGLNPVVAVSAFYAITSLLTQFMSNTASAALLVPVALNTAQLLDVNPQPLLIAVTVAASTSFATPVGYQTNLMVYGPGGYRFADFMKVGLPLNFIFWAFATFAIPRFWPL